MAHLVDGVLSTEVTLAATALAVAGTAYGLRKLRTDDLPAAALLGSLAFVGAMIHVPVGPSSAHLLLTGLLGALLGWVAVPVMLVVLTLQAVLLGFGGLTVLGANLFVMAAPAVAAHYLAVLVRRVLSRQNDLPRTMMVAGAVASGGAAILTGLLVAALLALSGQQFLPAAGLVLASHLPLAGLEGVVTAVLLSFLAKVKPDALMPATAPAATIVEGQTA